MGSLTFEQLREQVDEIADLLPTREQWALATQVRFGSENVKQLAAVEALPQRQASALLDSGMLDVWPQTFGALPIEAALSALESWRQGDPPDSDTEAKLAELADTLPALLEQHDPKNFSDPEQKFSELDLDSTEREALADRLRTREQVAITRRLRPTEEDVEQLRRRVLDDARRKELAALGLDQNQLARVRRAGLTKGQFAAVQEAVLSAAEHERQQQLALDEKRAEAIATALPNRRSLNALAANLPAITAALQQATRLAQTITRQLQEEDGTG